MHIIRIHHESYIELIKQNNDLFHGSQNSELIGKQKTCIIESDFISNRPFIYLVMEKSSTALIFIGRVNII
jgi:serine protease inhibitor